MTDTSTTHTSVGLGDPMRAGAAASPREPSGAVAATVGAAFGAVAFALCAMWLGPVSGLVIAVVSTLHAMWRRRLWAALAFVVAGALSAVALRPSATFALLGGLAYGFGLALAALRRHGDELLA